MVRGPGGMVGRRRDTLLAALAQRLPQLEPAGISAGLHLVTWLPPHMDEATVIDAAARAGVGIDILARVIGGL